MMIKPIILTMGMLACCCVQPTQVIASQTCPGLLFATDFDKAPVAGTRDALIEAVNRGDKIRVGWELDFNRDGKGELSHWADAAFLSVWKNEVFTQVDAIAWQAPRQGEKKISLKKPYAEWRGSLSSTGELTGSYSNDKEFPAGINARITWCSEYSKTSGPILLYRNGSNGETLYGSKEALFSAIRAGLPIQIGWGLKVEREGNTYSVEHLASPVFVTITNNSNVSAQLPEHIAQQHYSDISRALFDKPSVMWRGLMTTEGTFDAVWVDRASGETIRRHPQRVILSWYAPTKADLSTPSLAVPQGVTRDLNRAEDFFPTLDEKK